MRNEKRKAASRRSSGIVKNIGLTNANIKGTNHVGALAAVSSGKINNCFSTGSITGNVYVGGLVGYNIYGSIADSYSQAVVNGRTGVGGLAGYNYGSLKNSYATGSVTGSGCGNSYSYTCGDGRGGTYSAAGCGGLVGEMYYYGISNSFATGNVLGTSMVGGLAGHKTLTSAILTNSYWFNNQNSCISNKNGDSCTKASSIVYFYSRINAPMSSWDFVNTWSSVSGNYPKLIGFS